MASGREGAIFHSRPKCKGRPSKDALTANADKTGLIGLLDFRLAEFYVLLGDRIILLHDQLVDHGARILPGHIVEAGVGARNELDLDGGRFGHGNLDLSGFGRTLVATPEKSR